MIKTGFLLFFIYTLNLYSVKGGVPLYLETQEHWVSRRSPSNKCGFQLESSPSSSDNSTLPLEYPWLGMLIYQNSSSNKEKFTCNAVLINDRYVITAAQCVTAKILLRAGDIKKVRLGNGNLDCIHNYESKICTDAIDYRVEEVNIPDNYEDTKDRQDDIAVLRLDRIVEFTDSIRPVCLPGASKHIAGGQKLHVPSWGREIRGAGRAKAQVVVKTATNAECSLQYSKVDVNISDKQVCAGVEEGYNACDIISGAPLLKEKNGQFIMEGILSFGVHCTVKGWPDVYVAIPKYREWIDSIINL